MLKPEVFKSLKQGNIGKNPEKVMERIKAVWKPLAKPEREEILALSGMSKISVERAYKTGNVSAKLVAAFAQVLKLDPLYLAGHSDDARTFDENEDYVAQFLKGLGYELGKSDVVKTRKPRTTKSALPIPNELPPVEQSADESPAQSYPIHTLNDMDTMLTVTTKLLDDDARGKLGELTEEETMLLLQSLRVQAGFSSNKKAQFELIKALLLV